MRIVLEGEVGAKPFQGASPAIVFSLRRVVERAALLGHVTRAAGVELLVAVKASPDQRCLEVVGREIQGFDVSNARELTRIGHLARGKTISLTGPICGGLSRELVPEGAGPMILNAETEDQFWSGRRLAEAGIIRGVRLRAGGSGSSDVTPGPPFGFDEDRLSALLAASPSEGDAISAVQSHGGSREHTVDTIISRAGVCLESIRRLGLRVSIVNFGGGFTGLSVEQFAQCVGRLSELNVGCRTLIEPGEYFYEDCGWAEATVLDVTPTREGARAILDISSESHLRWSRAQVAEADAGHSAGCRVDFVGPTCFRGDFLGQRWIGRSDGRPFGVRVGDRVRIEAITSYSVAWNVCFNGVPPATLMVVDS